MRKTLPILLIAVLHFFATISCVAGVVATDRYLWNAPSHTHHMLSNILTVLEFPVLTIAGGDKPRGVEHYVPLLALNSLLWGSVIYDLYILSRRRKSA